MNTVHRLTQWFAFAFVLSLLLFSAACGGSAYMAEAAAQPEPPSGGAMPTSDAAGLESDGDRMEVAQISEMRSRNSSAPNPAPPGAAPARPPTATDATPPPPEPPPSPNEKTAAPGDQTPKQVASPLLIYRAEINMAVFETRATIDHTEKLARDMGGYLVRRSDREIIIRVPSAKFRDALAKVSGYGDVLHQNVDVEDVTEKFYDLSIRLKNMKAVRDRFEQLLTKAQSVEDSLRIERELERVTTQIEVLEGKLKLYRELIAFSTITLRLEPRGSDQVTPKVNLPFDWLRKLGLPSLLSM